MIDDPVIIAANGVRQLAKVGEIPHAELLERGLMGVALPLQALATFENASELREAFKHPTSTAIRARLSAATGLGAGAMAATAGELFNHPLPFLPEWAGLAMCIGSVAVYYLPQEAKAAGWLMKHIKQLVQNVGAEIRHA